MSGGKACDKAKVHIHIPVGRLSGEQPVIFAGQQGMRMEKVSEKAHKGGEIEKKEPVSASRLHIFKSFFGQREEVGYTRYGQKKCFFSRTIFHSTEIDAPFC